MNCSARAQLPSHHSIKMELGAKRVFSYCLSHCGVVSVIGLRIPLSVCGPELGRHHTSTSFLFNPVCTYHAASPPGSEQEKMEYALNSKRRALILALRWANAHTYMLQEEPAAVTFLEVTSHKALTSQSITRLLPIMSSLCLSPSLCLYRSCTGVYQTTLGR